MFKSYREKVADLLLLLACCYAAAIEGVARMKGVAQSKDMHRLVSKMVPCGLTVDKKL